MKRFLSALIALLMLLPVICSCASNNVNDQEIKEDAANTPSAELETEPVETEVTRATMPDNLPELDYRGETVTIHSRGDDESYYEVVSDELTGEVVNDEIYTRNLTVSDRFNVNIEAYKAETWESYNNAVASLRASIASGDGAYNIVAGWSARIPALSLEGLLLDLNQFEYLDLEKPWWNQSAVKELQIAGQLHLVTGDIAKTMLSAMCVFVFNQKLVSDFGFENLYDVVKEHRWTIDYVNDLVSVSYIDLNGNGKVDNADQFGLTTDNCNEADGFMQGFHVSMVSRDEEGVPYLDVDTEKMTTVVEKVYNLYWNNSGTYGANGANTDINLFKEDRAVLATMRIIQLVGDLAEMESDYGVIPYPLLDENQAEYGTRVQDALSLWCIPIDVKNPEMSSVILEALCAESYRKVTPAYFDVALKNRYSRDETTAEMMDLIVDSVLINFESLYNESINNIWFVLRTLIPQQSNNFASYWASREKVTKKTIEKAVEKIAENAGN